MAGNPDRSRPGPVTGAALRGPSATTCDLCGANTIEVRCKIICRRCGYTRDCSDP